MTTGLNYHLTAFLDESGPGCPLLPNWREIVGADTSPLALARFLRSCSGLIRLPSALYGQMVLYLFLGGRSCSFLVLALRLLQDTVSLEII